MSGGEEAWSRYWATPGGRNAPGCLPNRGGPVEAAQTATWQRLARSLSKGARVIDLGTGSGFVPATMAAARPDLKPIGVDSASGLPAAPRGVTLKGGVRMERLPFPEARFDATVSQFGYEYGDTERTAGEVARVTKRGGRLLLMIHHASGQILSHNLGRREALLWALQPGGPVERARAFAATGLGAGLPIPQSFASAAAEARRLYPEQSAAAEIVTGILQRLEIGRRAPAEARDLLARLEADARGEVARLSQLEGAARDEPGIAEIARQLEAAGFAAIELSALPDPAAGKPLAWIVDGRRRA